jgi:hypothetical protein
VDRGDALLDAVRPQVLSEEAEADVLRLDAREVGLGPERRQDEEPDGPDARPEVEEGRHGRALLESVPGGQQIVGRVPVTVAPLKDAPRRREAVDRDRLAELALELEAADLERFR